MRLQTVAIAGILILVSHSPAAAQVPDLKNLIPAGEASISGRMVQIIALLTVLSVAPGLLIMVTSFTRIIVALSFLRTGLGVQSAPANLVLISLALFMTFFVMQPTFEQAWKDGMKPLIDNQIDETQAFARIVDPFRSFMLEHVRDKDLRQFSELAGASQAQVLEGDSVQLTVLIPAFMVSELRKGFEIGFLIVLPFLIIDLIVATLTMSMGMMMLPPTVISLPFKVLFFLLIDGWTLLTGGLIRSFL